jgi:hypothetical protein
LIFICAIPEKQGGIIISTQSTAKASGGQRENEEAGLICVDIPDCDACRSGQHPLADWPERHGSFMRATTASVS